jgi:hypothetical protein
MFKAISNWWHNRVTIPMVKSFLLSKGWDFCGMCGDEPTLADDKVCLACEQDYYAISAQQYNYSKMDAYKQVIE